MLNLYLKKATVEPEPFSLSTSFYSVVERLLDDEFYMSLRRFDIDESDKAYTLTLELPGYKQSHLEITMEENALTVKAKREGHSYERTVTLPSDVDGNKIEAKLEDGLLVITLPKSPKAKPRTIEIK